LRASAHRGGLRVHPHAGPQLHHRRHMSVDAQRFVAAFVDALDIGRATFVGNSLGGLISLRLVLSDSTRVRALVLVDSAGLGRAVNPAFTSVNVPGLGETALPL
jgi:pimeloyl-ACP methyl ester carboxylesterase